MLSCPRSHSGRVLFHGEDSHSDIWRDPSQLLSSVSEEVGHGAEREHRLEIWKEHLRLDWAAQENVAGEPRRGASGIFGWLMVKRGS